MVSNVISHVSKCAENIRTDFVFYAPKVHCADVFKHAYVLIFALFCDIYDRHENVLYEWVFLKSLEGIE